MAVMRARVDRVSFLQISCGYTSQSFYVAKGFLCCRDSALLQRDIKVAFIGCRQKLYKHLKDLPGKIHLGTDAWTSPNNRSFISVTIQYKVDGSIQSYVLDVVELPRRHTGQQLAEYLAQVVENFGLEKKFFGCVCDNASANNVMIDTLPGLISSYPGVHAHVRSPSNQSYSLKKAQKESERDEGEENEDEEDSEADEEEVQDENDEHGFERDNTDGWVDERDSMEGAELVTLDCSAEPARQTLMKI
ncbi:hypothetical protein Agabi119p4_3856 [Agaricus bisporus var. burnettii]|uniref:DUF659 domain-containing protein n=1 Tax=Agaricus bisporus var. burnettii TaxID=192524 RepID=A0A8H7F5M1_AGABI|nr:hypothetical protein Agabi119p4_3856 [Agaricus bisporus var. burnettii]